MTSTTRQRQDPNRMKKKMSKEQLHLTLTKKRECDARALSIVECLIENEVDQVWMLENLEHINRCHMEDVIEERAIMKRCGYALCDNPLKLNINQKYHISTRSNKVYDVSRRKNFCSNSCYGAGNYILEQMLTSPLWLRHPKEQPQFQLLPISGLSRKSTPGDEVDLGRENIAMDPNKFSEKIECQNSKESTRDSVSKNLPSVLSSHSVNEEELEISNNEVVKEDLQEAPHLEKSMRNSNLRVIVENIEKDNNLGVERDLKSERISISKAKLSKERQLLKRLEKNDLTQNNLDPKWLVQRIERYLQEWITLDSLVLLLGDTTLKQEKINVMTERLKNEEVQKKYMQLCQKVESLQIDRDSEDEGGKTDLKPLPDYNLLKETGKKLEIKVKAFFEGKTVIDASPTPAEDPYTEETEDSSAFLPILGEKKPKTLRRRIVLAKLDKVLPEMLRTLAGGEFAVPDCIHSNGCGKTVKALVNTFSLSASNVIPKLAEWNLLGLVFIKLLSISEPRLRFLLGTERATKYVTMILMSYTLEPNYLDGLVATVTDVESFRKKKLLGTQDMSASDL